MPDLDQELLDHLRSFHWILDSQEDALRLRLQKAGFRIHSVKVTIETEPRGTQTPTFHSFAIRGEVQPSSSTLPKDDRDALYQEIAEALGVPPKRRMGFGRMPDKPGLWQFNYTGFDGWTDWHEHDEN